MKDINYVAMSSPPLNIRNESKRGRKRSGKRRIKSQSPKRKSDSLLWSDPGWRITQEFLNLSGQLNKVISVPRHFPLSHERRRDELAEEQVFNWIKRLEEIEGVRKIIFFYSLRNQGSKDEKDKDLGTNVAGEIDLSVYIDQRERKFNFQFEVKSYNNKAENKALYNPRKKNQMTEHVELLNNWLDLTEDQASKQCVEKSTHTHPLGVGKLYF